jgi:hypothetical protein
MDNGYSQPRTTTPRLQDRHVTLDLPFTPRDCPLCVQAQRGTFLTINLNNAIQHYRERHPGLSIAFRCSACKKLYKTKHAASCHMPKCKGPTTPDSSMFLCNECTRTFKTKRGLSQHERLVHPSRRNDARKEGATRGTSRPPATGFGKIWSKGEIDTMLRLEHEFKGDGKIAKRMQAFLPSKSLKQIRDKRKETTYQILLGHTSNAAIMPGSQPGSVMGNNTRADNRSPQLALPPSHRGTLEPTTNLNDSLQDMFPESDLTVCHRSKKQSLHHPSLRTGEPRRNHPHALPARGIGELT